MMVVCDLKYMIGLLASEMYQMLLNKTDEFGKEYVRCSTRTTLRRLRTQDSRSLVAQVRSHHLYDGITVLARVNSVLAVSAMERDLHVVAKNVDANSVNKAVEQKRKTVSAKKMAGAALKKSSADASGRIEIEEKKEECKPTKKEEESARTAQKRRRQPD